MADYDVMIIGSGLAGLTAGLFAARRGLSTLILESNLPGGHLVSIDKIEDFPGFPDGIAGYDLCPAVQRQAADRGVEFQRDEARSLQQRNGLWSVGIEEGRHSAKAVIVATGSSLKSLGVPGEEKLKGRGVSHCASCDGPLYAEQTIGVVGGGDSALQEALTLAAFAAHVIVFDASGTFSAQHSYTERAASEAKIEPRQRTAVEEVLGEEQVTGVRVRSLATQAAAEISLSGLFVYVGLRPNTSLLRNILELDASGRVPTDGWMRTRQDGLFAVGDIRRDSAAQAIAAAGDGATAAVAAHRYIRERFPGR